jgi:acetolactate synthase I/III small subunit
MSSLPETVNGVRSVLELTVNNHPGVMSHVCGLFSRRAYNVEGILCMPIGDGTRSRVWLMVKEDMRLEQMIKHLNRLEDVLTVRRHGADHRVFEQLEQYFQL